MPRPRYRTSSDHICDEIHQRQSFLLTSHARPDGDSIGSQLAMAFALDALGKQVRIVNADAAPDHYREFPGLDRIEMLPAVPADPTADAVIVMECSDLTRTGVDGLDGRYIINIDHHVGNTDVRRGQLVRRDRRRMRRDGVRPDPGARRAADAARSPRTSISRS